MRIQTQHSLGMVIESNEGYIGKIRRIAFDDKGFVYQVERTFPDGTSETVDINDSHVAAAYRKIVTRKKKRKEKQVAAKESPQASFQEP